MIGGAASDGLGGVVRGVLSWSGVAKSYAGAVEGISNHMLTWGVLVGVITCVGVCVCLGHKTTCVFALVFFVFLAT